MANEEIEVGGALVAFLAAGYILSNGPMTNLETNLLVAGFFAAIGIAGFLNAR